ncbi:universal stress protein [Arthrobacter agilis]|uniref:universal stress protein n=1 Tax=Arthrobacter agilis TaxID=37921 RepID=UPI002789CC7D|nr:universal stress protein [Arthrobacter agilis]MDQ0735087.1 nucleotide-binding universal stress UspA family protein [Arthrobacter agilis]
MDAPSTPRRRVIVVGVDGSPSSIAALQLAVNLMPLAGDTIHALAVWQHPIAFGRYSPPVEHDYEGLAREALDQAVTEAFPPGAPRQAADIERRVVRGLAVEVLIQESRHAAMVVVGSRGHGGFAGLLLGSVSSALAERAQCPVLVAHGALHLAEGETTALPPVRIPA